MDILIAMTAPLLRFIAVWCASVFALAFAAGMAPGAHILTLDLHLIFGSVFLIPGFLAAWVGATPPEDVNPNENSQPFDDVWAILFAGLFGVRGLLALIVAGIFYLVGGLSGALSGKAALLYAANPFSALFVGVAYIFIFCFIYRQIKLFARTEEDEQ
jgi:hypothetical protein